MGVQDEVGLGLVERYKTLQSELSGLITYINDTRRTLGGLHQELPAASDALSEVTQATETAAHNLIDLVEQLLAHDDVVHEALATVEQACKAHGDEAAVEAVGKLSTLSEERGDLLIRMMTELSFQDLTCQTINKISTTILEVERRVIGLIDKSSISAADKKSDVEMRMSHAGVSRLREKQSGESRQDMVDALLRGE